MLSCFVFQQKTESEPLLSEHLKEGRAVILEIAERVGKVQDYWKVGAGEGEVETRFKSGLMEVVFEWAKGTVSTPFL
jgi:antiviral helicase SKI2